MPRLFLRGSLRTWPRLAVTVSLGAALTAVFLGACFHFSRAGLSAASGAGPLRQLGPLEVGLPPEFAVTAGRLSLPWADGRVEVVETALAEGQQFPDRPGDGPAEDFTHALGLPARLRQTDYAESRYAGRPDRTRLTLELLFPDRGLVSLSRTCAYNPREDGARDIEALRRRQRDSFIEAAAAFLRYYRRLGPEAAAEAPFRAGWRTAGGHLSQWEGRPELRLELSPPPAGDRGRVTLTLDYGNPAAAGRVEDGPFRGIVAYGLGLRYDRRPAVFGGRPGTSLAVLAAGPPDPIHAGTLAADFRWTADDFEALPLTLELTARPPADRPGLIRLWGGLTSGPENF